MRRLFLSGFDMLSRALIALLLTMNLVLALWLWLRPPVAMPEEPAAPDTDAVPDLVLLSEEEGPSLAWLESESAEPDGPPQPTPGPESLVCLELGPFLTQADLRQVMTTLTPHAERVQYRQTRAMANRGYWVHLPAQGSRDAALAAARELSVKGLRDYYVVTAGERENTISLGLFRERSNAQKRLAEVRALGFDARLQPREDEVPHYWIDLMVGSDFDWASRIAGYAEVNATQVTCQ